MATDVAREDMLDRFSSWAEELTEIIERRVFGGQFLEVMNFVSIASETLVTRLTDDEREEQLTVCSQHRFTFREMEADLDLYLAKAEREYRAWTAPRYMKCQRKLIDDKIALFKAGALSKTAITVTKDDVQNQFLIDYEQENRAWHDYMEKIKRGMNLVKAIADDIDSRAKILMNLRYKQ
jgi:hypothetical protein